MSKSKDGIQLLYPYQAYRYFPDSNDVRRVVGNNPGYRMVPDYVGHQVSWRLTNCSTGMRERMVRQDILACLPEEPQVKKRDNTTGTGFYVLVGGYADSNNEFEASEILDQGPDIEELKSKMVAHKESGYDELIIFEGVFQYDLTPRDWKPLRK